MGFGRRMGTGVRKGGLRFGLVERAVERDELGAEFRVVPVGVLGGLEVNLPSYRLLMSSIQCFINLFR